MDNDTPLSSLTFRTEDVRRYDGLVKNVITGGFVTEAGTGNGIL